MHIMNPERDDRSNIIQKSILEGMSDGVLTIGFDGKIMSMNPAAEKIFEREADELIGMPFAASFFEYEENDDFNQTILNAIENANETVRTVVPFYTGSATKQLGVASSYLEAEGERIGVTVVVSDISEMVQLTLRNKKLNNAFTRFLSDEIVKEVMSSPDGLNIGGKKRELSIIMSDLRGFTAMSEAMEAHDLVAMLNHYLGEMTEIIMANRGTVIEFIGDGIMALFGAPVDSPNHAEDAVKAALEMQLKMEEINEWNLKRGYRRLEMGIGINTGEVIVGNIGSERRTKYGVIGSNVNTAGRVESYTVGGQILIAPNTRAMISAPLEIADEMEVFPKGVDKPLLLTSVSGLKEPYNIHLSTEEEESFTALDAPKEFEFILLDGKHMEGGHLKGLITAESEKSLLIESYNEIKKFDNLQMFIDGKKVYGKALRKTGNAWQIRVTARQ